MACTPYLVYLVLGLEPRTVVLWRFCTLVKVLSQSPKSLTVVRVSAPRAAHLPGWPVSVSCWLEALVPYCMNLSTDFLSDRDGWLPSEWVAHRTWDGSCLGIWWQWWGSRCYYLWEDTYCHLYKALILGKMKAILHWREGDRDHLKRVILDQVRIFVFYL